MSTSKSPSAPDVAPSLETAAKEDPAPPAKARKGLRANDLATLTDTVAASAG